MVGGPQWLLCSALIIATYCNIHYQEVVPTHDQVSAATSFVVERLHELYPAFGLLEVANVLPTKARKVQQNVEETIHEARQLRVYDPLTEDVVVFEALVPRKFTSNKTTEFSIDLELTLVRVLRSDIGDEKGQNCPEVQEKEEIQVETTVTEDAQNYRTLTKLFMHPGPKPSDTVNVVSANIWNYNYWDLRKHLLQETFNRMSPDIIGFQEVRSRQVSEYTTSRHQVWDLAKLLATFGRYNFIFVPAMAFKESDDEALVHEGLAVFSRFPIESFSAHQLPRTPNDGEDFHQRLCLHAAIRHPTGTVLHVLNSHLSLSARARALSFGAISQLAQQLAGPIIFMGDFNAKPGEIGRVAASLPAMQDAWLLAQGENSSQKIKIESDIVPEEEAEEDLSAGGGHSRNEIEQLSRLNCWTFNSWKMQSRIDYMYITGSTLKVLDMQVEPGVSQALDQVLDPKGGVQDFGQLMWPSDHRFLNARLRLSESETDTKGLT